MLGRVPILPGMRPQNRLDRPLHSIPPLARPVPGIHSRRSGDIRVGAELEEKLDHSRRRDCSRNRDRSIGARLFISRVDVCAGIQQQPHHLKPFILRGMMQRGVADGIKSVQCRTRSDQFPGMRQISLGRSPVQSSAGNQPSPCDMRPDVRAETRRRRPEALMRKRRSPTRTLGRLARMSVVLRAIVLNLFRAPIHESRLTSWWTAGHHHRKRSESPGRCHFIRKRDEPQYRPSNSGTSSARLGEINEDVPHRRAATSRTCTPA